MKHKQNLESLDTLHTHTHTHTHTGFSKEKIITIFMILFTIIVILFVGGKYVYAKYIVSKKISIPISTAPDLTTVNITAAKKFDGTTMITATGIDYGCGIEKYEFYINNKLAKTIEASSLSDKTKATYITDLAISEDIYVMITDEMGTTSKSNVVAIKDYYEIASLEDLKSFRDAVNAGKSFEGELIKITQDIDFNGSASNQFTPIGNSRCNFKGTFDGQGHILENLYIEISDMRFMSLFRVNLGTIKNLVIKDCNLNSKWNDNNDSGYIGGIAGLNRGTISKCAVIGNSTISFDYDSSQNVTTWLVGLGGIVGGTDTEGALIEECYNEALLKVNIEKPVKDKVHSIRVGGISGSNAHMGTTTVQNCFNKGDININVGINDSYTNNGIGGIIGEYETNTAIVKNNYNLGRITISGIPNSHIGAIVGEGYNNGVIIAENNYYNSSLGLSDTLGKAVALTTDQMKTKTFVNLLNKTQTYSASMNWNSEYIENENNVWAVRSSNYPILTWQ